MRRLLLVGALLLMGCGSVVPPGTVVIKLDAGGNTTIHREGVYKAYGRDRIYFIDTKLQSFTETLHILCKDKVNLTVDVKWIGSFEVSQQEQVDVIKEKVPSEKVTEGDISGFRLSLEQFYKTALKDIIRATARQQISPYVTDIVPEKRTQIEATVRKMILGRLDKLNYPVATADILLSNIDFDEKVTETRKAIKAAQLEDEKRAALADAAVRQAVRDKDIARERGKALIEESKARAQANAIMTKSLTPEILALKQWEVLEKMATGPNNEMIVIPFDALRTDMLGTTMNRQSFRGSRKN